MKVINASGIQEVSLLLQKQGVEVEEKYDLANLPPEEIVILSDETDPTAEVSNTLAFKQNPVLYLAFHPPANLSTNVSVLKGEKIHGGQILYWIQDVAGKHKRRATIQAKKSIAYFGVQPGVGAGTLARATAILSSAHRKTLYIELNYYFPQSPFLFLLSDSNKNLASLFEHVLQAEDKNQIHLEPFLLNKTTLQGNRSTYKFMDHLPDDLSVISPHPDSLLAFPDLGSDIVRIQEKVQLLIETAKTQFDSIIFSMGSTPDDPLALATLRAVDQRVFVLDTNPSSVMMFQHRLDLLYKTGVPEINNLIVLQKSGIHFKKEIEKTLNFSIDMEILFETKMLDSLRKLDLLGSDQFKNSVSKLEKQLLGTPEAEKKRFKLGGIASLIAK
ncbi:hypothetical protein P9265_14745 [Schinkia azotoformans]|uniref:hypothetical protein n=1 Tax=Schinkia azotoformans TaxID=1454 RepID=UPI002E1FF8BD|nr:hypothetical protein [Schinkia azotoformans]